MCWALRRHPASVLSVLMVAIGLVAERDIATAAEFSVALCGLTGVGLLTAAVLALRYQWVGKARQALSLMRLACGLMLIAGGSCLLSPAML